MDLNMSRRTGGAQICLRRARGRVTAISPSHTDYIDGLTRAFYGQKVWTSALLKPRELPSSPLVLCCEFFRESQARSTQRHMLTTQTRTGQRVIDSGSMDDRLDKQP